jgi:hypothetical protein
VTVIGWPVRDEIFFAADFTRPPKSAGRNSLAAGPSLPAIIALLDGEMVNALPMQLSENVNGSAAVC